jgi:hypothetical protein
MWMSLPAHLPGQMRGPLAKNSGHSEVHRAASLNSKFKIDFFTALCGMVRNAGIGLPAKGRAPVLVAGWAPRISQKSCFGVRLFMFGISVHKKFV